jgi:hypothetical protein
LTRSQEGHCLSKDLAGDELTRAARIDLVVLLHLLQPAAPEEAFPDRADLRRRPADRPADLRQPVACRRACILLIVSATAMVEAVAAEMPHGLVQFTEILTQVEERGERKVQRTISMLGIVSFLFFYFLTIHCDGTTKETQVNQCVLEYDESGDSFPLFLFF